MGLPVRRPACPRCPGRASRCRTGVPARRRLPPRRSSPRPPGPENRRERRLVAVGGEQLVERWPAPGQDTHREQGEPDREHHREAGGSRKPASPLCQRDGDQHHRPQKRQVGQQEPGRVEPARERGDKARQRRLGRRLGPPAPRVPPDQEAPTPAGDRRSPASPAGTGPDRGTAPPGRERPFAGPSRATALMARPYRARKPPCGPGGVVVSSGAHTRVWVPASIPDTPLEG